MLRGSSFEGEFMKGGVGAVEEDTILERPLALDMSKRGCKGRALSARTQMCRKSVSEDVRENTAVVFQAIIAMKRLLLESRGR